MKFLRCKVCKGEMDIIGDRSPVVKKVRCRKCGFSNDAPAKGPEVVVIRRRG